MLIKSILAIACVAMILTFVIVVYGKDRFFDRIWGDPDLGAVDFSTLQPAAKPNQALACPKSFCPDREPDFISHNYALTAEQLKGEFARLIVSLPQFSKMVYEDQQSMRFTFRSNFWRFPDTLEISIIPLANGKSTFAALSRSKIGHSDFGVNKQRLSNLLSLLKSH